MTPTILITFLGTGNYTPARYQFSGSDHPDNETFFSAALASHLKPTRVISLQTPDATTKHGKALDQRFRELNVEHSSVSIPEGKSESELWEIFAALTQAVPAKCVLHVDVTHGFRSLPILSLIALNYLRTTRDVTLGGIHYGAFEAKSNEVTPVFDLSPFLALLDWTAAADQFLATGSASRLGSMLKGIQQSMWQNRQGSAPSDLPTKLISLGSTLEIAANNLTLLRTGAISDSAASVAKQITNATQTGDIERFALPILDVLDPVRAELTSFNSTDLAVLRDLVGWLIEKDRPDAALTLASEWIISWVMVRLGISDHHCGENIRKPYDKCISLWVDEYSGRHEIKNPDEESTRHLVELKEKCASDEMVRLAGIASRLKSARNDLNHAGFRQGPLSAANIFTTARELYQELVLLPT
ncbi:MAG: TIGR02221 family CRISPR-associated protein [Verrucomicrobiales bacterium]|nr:TIGR02221 family CRISPR-associated protein [Verrucomicrobiota bacterium JB025]